VEYSLPLAIYYGAATLGEAFSLVQDLVILVRILGGFWVGRDVSLDRFEGVGKEYASGRENVGYRV